MVKSALNFAAGFFGIPYEGQFNLELTVESPGFNNTFAPYATCRFVVSMHPNSDGDADHGLTDTTLASIQIEPLETLAPPRQPFGRTSTSRILLRGFSRWLVGFRPTLSVPSLSISVFFHE
jgi:hypothetical protein